MHHEGLDLALQHLHASGGDHGADVRHHVLAQDVADQPVVPLESRRGGVLQGEAIVII